MRAKEVNVNEPESEKDIADRAAKLERKFEFDGTSIIWLNITKSGKGVKIVTQDDRMFISSLANLDKLVSGEHTGVKFTELVEIVS